MLKANPPRLLDVIARLSLPLYVLFTAYEFHKGHTNSAVFGTGVIVGNTALEAVAEFIRYRRYKRLLKRLNNLAGVECRIVAHGNFDPEDKHD